MSFSPPVIGSRGVKPPQNPEDSQFSPPPIESSTEGCKLKVRVPELWVTSLACGAPAGTDARGKWFGAGESPAVFSPLEIVLPTMELWYRITDAIARFFGRIGGFFSHLSDRVLGGVERFFATLFRPLLKLFEGVDRFDDFAIGVGKLLAWPFVALWRMLAALGRMIVPESVANRFGAIPGRIGAVAQWLADALNLDIFVQWGIWLTQPLWVPIASLLGFLNAWLTTRNWRHMLWGLPVVMLFLPFAFIFVSARFLGGKSVETRYQLASKLAEESGDYEKLNLIQAKLGQLGVATDDTRFRSALKLADEGKYNEAYEMVKPMAPLTSRRYLPAHHWIAQNLLAERLPEPADQINKLVETHLDILEKAQVRDPSLKIMRAAVRARQKKYNEAAALLKPLADENPQIHLELLRLALASNDLIGAKTQAQRVCTYLSTRADKDEKLEESEYQFWSMAAELRQDIPQLRRALEGWIELNPEAQPPRLALAALQQQEFARLFRDPLADADATFAAFMEVMKTHPDRSWIDAQVGQFFQLRSQYPRAAHMVTRLMEQSELDQPVLVSIGTFLALSKESAKAIDYLRRGATMDPQDPIAWNNLAWALSEKPEPTAGELEEALAAANSAVKLSPDEARFRETRGQIHRKLKHWPETIEDLEFAVNGMPDSAEVHRGLAEAYEATGETELAAAHRREIRQ